MNVKEHKKIIPSFVCRHGQAIIQDLGEEYYSDNAVFLGRYYSDNGADALLLFDGAVTEEDHADNIMLFKEICRSVDIPLIVGGCVRDLEDVLKYLFAGAQSVFLDMSAEDNLDLLKEAADRFGSEKIYAYLGQEELFLRAEEFAQLGACGLLVDLPGMAGQSPRPDYAMPAGVPQNLLTTVADLGLPVLLMNDDDSIGTITSCLKIPSVAGVVLTVPGEKEGNSMALKQELRARGIPVETLESSVEWEAFCKNGEGLMPVIVQDCRTQEVLTFGYLDEASFETTLETGKMTYFSRETGMPVLFGEETGGYQYVRSLVLNSAGDTLLAKVAQIGPAGPGGSRTNFVVPLAARPCREGNPLRGLEEAYRKIKNRRAHPEEGSYVNYLFDKGPDKILKKVGEEAAKVIIAAKNPNPEEMRYEVSGLLYHTMVLMVEKGLTWEEIAEELKKR